MSRGHRLFVKEIAEKAAVNLGWAIDKDGFLIHNMFSEMEAQEKYNKEYNRVYDANSENDFAIVSSPLNLKRR